jgi:F-type H+-transporting ATPase subunit epsilon
MARNRFVTEVFTPDGEVFSDEVEMISTRTTVGSIGLLANHSPLLARLEPTELRLYRSDTEIVRFAQAEGYIQMAENRALLLVEEAIDPARLDRREIEANLAAARSEAQGAEPGTELARRSGREIRRYEAFLAMLNTGH